MNFDPSRTHAPREAAICSAWRVAIGNDSVPPTRELFTRSASGSPSVTRATAAVEGSVERRPGPPREVVAQVELRGEERALFPRAPAKVRVVGEEPDASVGVEPPTFANRQRQAHFRLVRPAVRAKIDDSGPDRTCPIGTVTTRLTASSGRGGRFAKVGVSIAGAPTTLTVRRTGTSPWPSRSTLCAIPSTRPSALPRRTGNAPPRLAERPRKLNER